MGCGASSQSVCVAKSVEKMVSGQREPQITNKNDHLKLIPLPVKKNASAGTQDSGINSHFDSEDCISERRGSLTSQSDSDDNLCHNFITEHSDRDVVCRIESEFVDREDLDLSVVGTGCPPLLSDKEKQIKSKKEELESIEMLKNNGLVPKPALIHDSFALLEIVEEKQVANRAPPTRLAMQKEKISPTLEQIRQRLERANERKKEKMKIKLAPKDDKVVVKYNPENDVVLERQMRLKQLRDKLKTKETDVNSPRSKELFNELDNFRPKTASNFRPEF